MNRSRPSLRISQLDKFGFQIRISQIAIFEFGSFVKIIGEFRALLCKRNRRQAAIATLLFPVLLGVARAGAGVRHLRCLADAHVLTRPHLAHEFAFAEGRCESARPSCRSPGAELITAELLSSCSNMWA
jgi:hypothetical protein